MVHRKGIGIGLGQGFKNMMPQDPMTHSLSARGIKSTYNIKKISVPEQVPKFGIIPTAKKKGLIKEIARKVNEGVHWAIVWEKKHLPSQKAWVKKEFKQAKELAQRGLDKVKDKVEQIKEDMDDVRDEMDTDDDGTQDISIEEFNDTNVGIRQELDTIDVDNSGVPDYVEEMPDGVQKEPSFLPSLEIEPVEEETKPSLLPEVKPSGDGGFFKKLYEQEQKVQKKVVTAIDTAREEKAKILAMSDAVLKERAVREKSGAIFGLGKNKYEQELYRRAQKRLTIASELAKTKAKKKKELKEGKSLGVDVSFLNPFSGLTGGKK